MSEKRQPAEIAADRKRIAEMYLKGRLQADIAKEIGVDQSTVSRDLKALHSVWLRSALMDFSAAKARELARIDLLEVTYWDAWARSCEQQETSTSELVKDGEGFTKGQKAALRKEPGLGDPRFLQGVQWCIERRCKIIGIDAPIKQVDIDLSQLSDEQLEQIVAGEDLIAIAASGRSSIAAKKSAAVLPNPEF